ncbi:hypothetical protein GCM10018773_23090 [Streptomyces candidus]|nr:hypothetical protein GCM10018773_23090 [Streptomyces candidus]
MAEFLSRVGGQYGSRPGLPRDGPMSRRGEEGRPGNGRAASHHGPDSAVVLRYEDGDPVSACVEGGRDGSATRRGIVHVLGVKP